MSVKIKASEKPIQGKPALLIIFVALSVLTHGLFFLFHANSETSPLNKLVHTSIGNQILNVTLSSTGKKAKEHEKVAVKNFTQNPKHNFSKKIAKITLSEHEITAIAKEIQQELISKTALRITQQNFLLGEIQHRLSRYLSYPMRAQRRGWQGEVMVGFHVDKHGFLHNIHLAQTSGYSLLDNATLSAIGKVKSIPLSLWLKNNHGDEFHPAALQLPVTYRLTNS